MTEPRRPNSFELSGDYGIEVRYDETSITGRPRLTYKDADRDVSVEGDEIRREETSIGALVSAHVESIPDARVVDVSLLLPTVNLGDGDAEIEALLIETTARTSIGGPALVTGAIQSYRAHAVRGTARLVQF